MKYFYIYLVGYVLLYMLIRLSQGEPSGNWKDVKRNMLISLMSWIFILIFIIFALDEKLDHKSWYRRLKVKTVQLISTLKNYKQTPPRWL